MKTVEEWLTDWHNGKDSIANILIHAQSAAFREGVESVQKWIPVSERLPKEDGRYLILYQYRDSPRLRAFIGDFYRFEQSWSCMLNDTKVVHWMPLPPLPEEQKEKPQ